MRARQASAGRRRHRRRGDRSGIAVAARYLDHRRLGRTHRPAAGGRHRLAELRGVVGDPVREGLRADRRAPSLCRQAAGLPADAVPDHQDPRESLLSVAAVDCPGHRTTGWYGAERPGLGEPGKVDSNEVAEFRPARSKLIRNARGVDGRTKTLFVLPYSRQSRTIARPISALRSTSKNPDRPPARADLPAPARSMRRSSACCRPMSRWVRR